MRGSTTLRKNKFGQCQSDHSDSTSKSHMFICEMYFKQYKIRKLLIFHFDFVSRFAWLFFCRDTGLIKYSLTSFCYFFPRRLQRKVVDRIISYLNAPWLQHDRETRSHDILMFVFCKDMSINVVMSQCLSALIVLIHRGEWVMRCLTILLPCRVMKINESICENEIKN